MECREKEAIGFSSIYFFIPLYFEHNIYYCYNCLQYPTGESYTSALQLRLYEKLRSVCHDNIVKFLFVAEVETSEESEDRSILVSSMFHGLYEDRSIQGIL